MSILLGDVELATSNEVVVAWWGSSTPPKGHILAEEQDVNTIFCHPQEENTMLSEQASGWMNFLLKSQPMQVADIYAISSKYYKCLLPEVTMSTEVPNQ